MIVQITNQKGEQEIIEVQTYKIKKYIATTFLQQLTYLLIRPPRVVYNQALLDRCNQNGRKYQHIIFCIPFPLSLFLRPQMKYVVLYLHGNSSNRLQGFDELSKLPSNVGLACFDFDGCGNRLQRDYISLGKSESKQVDIAANFLTEKGYKVIGWGRSMGSVSLLLSSVCQILVVDSPFSSLRNLCFQNGKSQIPKCCGLCYLCVFPCMLCLIESKMKQKIDMTTKDLQIIELINHNKNRSILFLAGNNDQLIDPKHAKALYDKFEGRKQLMIFEGDHNSSRPSSILQYAHLWIQNQITNKLIQQFNSLKNNINSQQIILQTTKSNQQMMKQQRNTMSSPIRQTYDESAQNLGSQSGNDKADFISKYQQNRSHRL